MGNLENVKIACLGFDVSAEAKENILIIFKKLLEEVPYDAFINMNLQKVPTGIAGKIHVSSIAGEFVSAQVEMTPQALVEGLYKDLRRQLMDWKSRRFSEEPTEVTA